MPTLPKLEKLVSLAEQVEGRFGITLDYISGGNSSNLALMEMDGVIMPPRINNLRVGAAILRGENSITGGLLRDYDDNGFTLQAELVEIKTKHSLPDGETGPDAFGNRLTFEDRASVCAASSISAASISA
jgi:predicted amino acid racemase